MSSLTIYYTTELLLDVCVNSDNGKTDEDGDGCSYYDSSMGECGEYDDDDFKAKELCCSCGGGKGKNRLICFLVIVAQ